MSKSPSEMWMPNWLRRENHANFIRWTPHMATIPTPRKAECLKRTPRESPPARHARVALAEYTLTMEVSTNRKTTTQMTRSPRRCSDRKSANRPVISEGADAAFEAEAPLLVG